MRAEDIRSFMERDWARAQRAKARHWREVVVAKGARPALQIADALRLHAGRHATAGTLVAEREADFAHHVELKRRIDAANAALGR